MQQTKGTPSLEQIAKTAGRVASSHKQKQFLGALADGVKSGRKAYDSALKMYGADLKNYDADLKKYKANPEKYKADVSKNKEVLPSQEPLPIDLASHGILSADATSYETTQNNEPLPAHLASHMVIPRPQSVAVLSDQNVRSYAYSIGYFLQLVKVSPELLVPNDSVTTSNTGVINDLLTFEKNTGVIYNPAVSDLVVRWANKMAHRIRKNGEGAMSQQMVNNYHRLIKGVVVPTDQISYEHIKFSPDKPRS